MQPVLLEAWTDPEWSTLTTTTFHYDSMNFRMYGIVVHLFCKKKKKLPHFF